MIAETPLDALIARADANTKVLADWVAKTPWVDFLAKDATIRSNTSVCLEVVDPAITELAPDAQACHHDRARLQGLVITNSQKISFAAFGLSLA
jgi:phosphoserine aminotransferase